MVLPAVTGTAPAPREALVLTWQSKAVNDFLDDWDRLDSQAVAAFQARPPAGPGTIRRPRILKSDVARHGILNGITDWQAWVRGVPNDPRRRRRPLGPSDRS